MKNAGKIAIVIRRNDQLAEALRSGRNFCKAGMKVSIFVLGDCLSTADKDAWTDMAERLPVEAECYSCHPTEAKNFGFDTASFGQMAEKITDADLVISY